MSYAYDILIVGGGPAGAVCAAVCARAGLSVAVVERAVFPREKVCGDCVNPGCWKVLDALDLGERVMALESACLDRVEIGYASKRPVRADLPQSDTRREIAVTRLLLDHAVLERARELGAHVFEGSPLQSVARVDTGWQVVTGTQEFRCRWLVAADGRNSTVCRQLGILPKSSRERVALQTYAQLTSEACRTVGLRVLPFGYCGYADVGGGRLNLCLVGKSRDLPALREWASQAFTLDVHPVWRSVSPVERDAVAAAHDRLLLVGDAARVVEPFTGEGIRYAMESGYLAGQCLAAGKRPEETASDYMRGWHAIYRGRLWVNHFAREAVKHPALASPFLALCGIYPPLLRALTAKVVSA